MAVKPILFNKEMVQAILSGQKTQTRRLVKPQPVPDNCKNEAEEGDVIMYYGELCKLRSPKSNRRYAGELDAIPMHPYKPGDILYVRETWKKVCATEDYYEFGDVVSSEELFGFKYCADNSIVWDERKPRSNEFFNYDITEELVWHPSIHMPKKAARIFLEVTDVRIERLQGITIDGCKKEGIWDDYKTFSEKYHENLIQRAYPVVFAKLWDSTIKPADIDRYGWAANPWVWVIEFERCEKPEVAA